MQSPLTMSRVFSLHTPAWLRAWQTLQLRLAAARADAAERRLVRELLRQTNGLDDATRRDLGLPERGPVDQDSAFWAGAWMGR